MSEYDLSKLIQQSKNEQKEFIDPYPSERVDLMEITTLMQRKYKHTSMNEDNMARFADEFKQRAYEKNLKVIVDWEFTLSDTNPPVSVAMPTVSIVGRVNKEYSADHERFAHEIQSGLLDGKKGVTKTDGTRVEDSKRKNIY